MTGELIPTGVTFGTGRKSINSQFSGTAEFNNVIIASGANFSGGTGGGVMLSGGTNLYSIFQTTADGNDITRVQPGSNIITGGTGNSPTISINASPSFNNIIISGSGQFNSLSATTLSGGTILSGGTNLYSIFSTDLAVWSSGTGFNSVIIKNNGGIASGILSVSEGSGTTASGNYSHAEGNQTYAASIGSHAEGQLTIASGSSSHAEGSSTTANGIGSHAEGVTTKAYGNSSHAEGQLTIASGSSSHAEGGSTKSLGDNSHSEGVSTTSIGNASHAEGTTTTAIGDYSHAGGFNSKSSGETSFVHGDSSTANGIGTIVLGNGLVGNTDNTIYVSSLNINSVGAGPGITDLGVDAGGYVVNQASDVRIKENVLTITGALNTVNSLRGVTYNWIDRERGGNALKLGFIAQEVNEVIPELAFTNPIGGLMGVHYKDVPALLVEAVKELSLNNTRTIPFYTPTSSDDENGSEGNITRDDNYLYMKTLSGWRRSNMESF